MHIKSFIFLTASLFLCRVTISQGQPLFRNAKAPMEARMNDLLHTLTLQEKISLLGNKVKIKKNEIMPDSFIFFFKTKKGKFVKICFK